MGLFDRSAPGIEGTVERVVFRSRDTGYTVIRLQEEGAPALRTVVGRMQPLSPGERVRFSGEWVVDPRHGRQFRAITCLPLAPATVKGIEKFLGSGLIPGIGSVMAGRLTGRFGIDTLEVIENEPDRLAEVPGIGPKRARAIRTALLEKRAVKDVMVFLESAGVSPAFAHRIHKRYGNEAIRLVSENPYRLAADVQGIGFLSADRIAGHLGVPEDSPHRFEAGLLHVLDEMAGEGQVFALGAELIARAGEMLGGEGEALEGALERLVLMGGARREGRGGEARLYLPRLYRAEVDAANSLQRLLDGKTGALPVDAAEAVRRAEASSGIELAPEQRRAFAALQQAKVLVLTGGPGTGKTTLLRGVADCLTDLGLRVALAAPTGRATRRMAESTGREARTIHRLLEFAPRTRGFQRDRQNPLEEDLVIVDEASMVDLELFAALLDALRPWARLILVGDPDQLPSVGPGTVLADLLLLGRRLGPRLQVVCLTEIFRQARRSMIVTGAHEVLAGRVPQGGERDGDADMFVIEREDPEECLDAIRELVQRRIPGRFGFHPIDDIQVLTPMHRGLLGATNLNATLRDLLNPGPAGEHTGFERYRVGDKVMQIRNNYDLEVFNGDLGRVTAVGDEGAWVEAAFPDRVLRYPAVELDQLTPAYACTVHKSQGSEYPAVVLPLHTQHFVMLRKNLLYTAITRGRRLVVIVGSKRALRIAVRTDDRQTRNSALAERVLAAPSA